jgi:orotidine-5'-phosphate decarboxylase
VSGVQTCAPPFRPAGAATLALARPCTPGEALDAGADILVIGRAVTQADDPVEAAESLVDSLT